MMDGNGDGGELVNHAQVDGWRGKGWSASVTDFRPIWVNTVEVAHMTSSVMYINSHAKGTSLPLARITTMIPHLILKTC